MKNLIKSAKFRMLRHFLTFIIIFALTFYGFWTPTSYAADRSVRTRSVRTKAKTTETRTKQSDTFKTYTPSEEIQVNEDISPVEDSSLQPAEVTDSLAEKDTQQIEDINNPEEEEKEAPRAKDAGGETPNDVLAALDVDPEAGISANPINLNASLFTGALNLSVPFGPVSPGRTGMQPDVSITYSSNRKKGWMGVGFDVSVVGSIKVSLDQGVPKYDGTDKFEFEFNGSTGRLVDTDNGYHLPEVNTSFTRFYKASRPNPTYRDYWIVKEKSGKIYIFGFDNNSWLSVASKDAQWHINYIIDTLGNFIRFKYEKDNLVVYLKSIEYVGKINIPGEGITEDTIEDLNLTYIDGGSNEVIFELEGRDDLTTSHIYGFAQAFAKRLQYIEAKHNNIPITRYTFNYDSIDSIHTTKSRITQINRSSSKDGISWENLPAIKFAYEEIRSGTKWSYVENYSNLEIMGTNYWVPVLLADYDGDGLTDIGNGVFRKYYGNSQPYVDSDTIYSNTGDNSFGESNLHMPDVTEYMDESIGGGGSVELREWYGRCTTDLQVVDLNGDGLLDTHRSRHLYPAVACNLPENVSINRGESGWDSGNEWLIFDGENPIAPAFEKDWSNLIGHAHAADVRFADFNGDGLSDVFFSVAYGQRTYPWHIISDNWGNGSYGRYSRLYFNNGHGWGYRQATSGVSDSGSGIDFLYTIGSFKKNGQHDELYTSWTSGTRFLDLNGDSLTDVITLNYWAQVYEENYPDMFFPDTTPYGKRVMINNGKIISDGVTNGFNENEQIYYNIWGKPLSDNGMNFLGISYDGSDYLNNTGGWDVGVRFFDINGDGFVDVLRQVEDEPKKCLINTGNGWDDIGTQFSIPVDFVIDSSFVDAGVKFVDLNQDGYQDVIRFPRGIGEQIIYSYINKIYTYPSAPYQHPMHNLKAPPKDYITVIDNGAGLTTYIEYTSAKGEASVPNEPGFMPFLKPVVSKITYKDHDFITGKEVVKTYSYDMPLYYQEIDLPNDIRRDFRGFKNVVETLDNKERNTYEFMQDMPYIGMVKRVNSCELLSGDCDLFKTHKTVENIYDSFYQESENWYFPYLEKTINTVTDVGAPEVVTAVEYEYDLTSDDEFYNSSQDFGNVMKATNLGFFVDTDEDGEDEYIQDNYSEETSYAYENTSNAFYIKGKVFQIDTKDSANNLLRSTRMYYDQTALGSINKQGLLTKTEVWRDEDSDGIAEADEYIQNVRIEYYPDYGLVHRTYDAKNYLTEYTYDDTFTYPKTVKNAKGHITTYHFYENTGKLKSVEDPNLPVGLCDDNGDGICSQRFIYDAFGRLTGQYRPSPDLTAEELQTEYEYIYDNWPVRLVTKVKFNNSNIVTIAKYNGFGEEFRLESDMVVDGEKKIVTIDKEYDYKGRPKKEYLPYIENAYYTARDETHVKEHFYDILDREYLTKLPDGRQIQNIYQGNIQIFCDANCMADQPLIEWKRQVQYTYDAYGNLTRVEELGDFENHGSVVTQYEYSPLGELGKVIKPRGEEIIYTYNTLGQLTVKIDPIFGNRYYTYDNNVNLETVSDEQGLLYTLSYDELNRIVKNDIDDPTENDINYVYDTERKGELSRVYVGGGASPTYNKEFYYDNLGRVSQNIEMIEGQTHSSTITYNQLDAMETLTMDDILTSYSYDEVGSINGVNKECLAQPCIRDIRYNKYGQVTLLRYGNGLATGYFYDPLNTRITRITTRGDFYESGGDAGWHTPTLNVQNLGYTYDKVGNITKIADDRDTINSGYKLKSYSYDDFYRLKQAIFEEYQPSSGPVEPFDIDTVPSIDQGEDLNDSEVLTFNEELNPWLDVDLHLDSRTIDSSGFMDAQSQEQGAATEGSRDVEEGHIYYEVSYGYDELGNIINRNKDVDDGSDSIYEYQYYTHIPVQLRNIPTKQGARSDIEYDSHGNIIRAFGKSFTFDSLDRLIEVDVDGGVHAEFLYDDSGNRIKKAVNGASTYYFLGGQLEINEDRAVIYFKMGTKNFAKVDDGVVYYFHNDHLNSSNIVTNDQGVVSEEIEYFPFGGKYTDSAENVTTYKFTGQKWNEEIDLYYYGARYYDPDIARFISPDPAMNDIMPEVYVLDPQQQNPYSYVSNNPLKYIDPTGNSQIDAILREGGVSGDISRFITGLRYAAQFIAGFIPYVSTLYDAETLRRYYEGGADPITKQPLTGFDFYCAAFGVGTSAGGGYLRAGGRTISSINQPIINILHKTSKAYRYNWPISSYGDIAYRATVLQEELAQKGIKTQMFKSNSGFEFFTHYILRRGETVIDPSIDRFIPGHEGFVGTYDELRELLLKNIDSVRESTGMVRANPLDPSTKIYDALGYTDEDIVGIIMGESYMKLEGIN